MLFLSLLLCHRILLCEHRDDGVVVAEAVVVEVEAVHTVQLLAVVLVGLIVRGRTHIGIRAAEGIVVRTLIVSIR